MNSNPIQPEDQECARSFLQRYMGLVNETGFAISSCGCCDSPWIVKVTDADRTSDPNDDEHSPCDLGRHFDHLDQGIARK